MFQKAHNVCDIDLKFFDEPENFTKIQKKSDNSDTLILYAGSYFCSNYFQNWINRIDDITVFKENAEAKAGKKITLIPVVPIPSERTSEKIKTGLKESQAYFKEIVVNDYGTMVWCAENLDCDIIMGRLFMRQPRDIRYEKIRRETFKIPMSIKSISDYGKKYRVKGIEMDGFGAGINAEGLPEDMFLGVHRPWIMMSCDMICEDASSDAPIDKKFRADLPCALNCSGVRHMYKLANGEVCKAGRGIYAYQGKDPVIQKIDNSRIRYIEYYPLLNISTEQINER